MIPLRRLILYSVVAGGLTAGVLSEDAEDPPPVACYQSFVGDELSDVASFLGGDVATLAVWNPYFSGGDMVYVATTSDLYENCSE